ncbi:MAG: LysR family transcriptional regulator [Myxococcota bacterium]
MDDFDWRWIRSFIVVAEAGGATAGERVSVRSQATLSRHVRALEEYLGVALFERGGRSLMLSPRGQQLLEEAMAVRSAVHDFDRKARGLASPNSGAVRVTMSCVFGLQFAPEWLSDLRQAHPNIEIDLVLEDDEVNLLLRDAEIAVRMFRPRQLELVTVEAGATTRGFFASDRYLASKSAPRRLEELFDHELVGFDRWDHWLQQARSMGYTFRREDFGVRSDAVYAHASLIAAGLGIGVLPLFVGQRQGLTRVFPAVSLPGFPVYLAAHPELRSNPLVSKVWAHLKDALQKTLNASKTAAISEPSN